MADARKQREPSNEAPLSCQPARPARHTAEAPEGLKTLQAEYRDWWGPKPSLGLHFDSTTIERTATVETRPTLPARRPPVVVPSSGCCAVNVIGPPTPPRLGTLLELLDGALDQVTTFEGEFRDWARPEPSLTMLVGRGPGAGERGDTANLRWRGGGPFPFAQQLMRHIWFRSPASLRVEMRRNHRLVRFGIRDGTRWWRWDEREGDSEGEVTGPAPVSPLPPLLDPPVLTPARVLARTRLETHGVGVRAGRNVVLAHGRMRGLTAPSPGIRHELEFDAEHGIMLRAATFVNERCVESMEALSIEFDGALEPALFEHAPFGRRTP